MKRLLIACLLMLLSGCASHHVYCDWKLEPINPPAEDDDKRPRP